MSSIADAIRKESKRKIVQNRTNRVQKSIKQSAQYGRQKSKPSKSDMKYINGDIVGSASGKYYGIKNFGDGDFSRQKRILEAGGQKLENWEAQRRGENPYQLQYIRTSGYRTIPGGVSKNGNKYGSFKAPNVRRVTERDLQAPIAQIYTPKTKLERMKDNAGRAFFKTLTTLNKGQSAVLGGFKTIGDESYEMLFEPGKFKQTGGFKDSINKFKKNVSDGWKTGENSFGSLINERMDKTEKEQNMKFTKGGRFLGSATGLAMDVFNPYDLTPNIPIGTFVKGTGKSFTKVPTKLDASDIENVLDKVLNGKQISEQARESIIHRATKKANKYAGNIEPRSGMHLGNMELLKPQTIANLGDATGVSRAYNEVRHILQSKKRGTSLEDVVSSVANKKLGKNVELLNPLEKTYFNMQKEKYSNALGILPNSSHRAEMARLDNGFKRALDNDTTKAKFHDDMKDIVDGFEAKTPMGKTRDLENQIKDILGLNVEKITANNSDMSQLDKIPKHAFDNYSNRIKDNKIKNFEKELGMTVDDFTYKLDKVKQDEILNKLPQEKADFLLDKIDSINPKVNQMFDDKFGDGGSKIFDEIINKSVPSVEKTPHLNPLDKDKEKQAVESLLNIFKKKYNTGDTANYKLPHKNRQDIFANSMKDLFDANTPISEKTLKHINRYTDFVDALGKKKMKETDKDNIAKALNNALFGGKPVLRNNMGDKDFKDFARLLKDGVEDTLNKVPNDINRGAKDYKMWVNIATDPNTELKARYLASKYKGEKRELKAKVDELARLAKKDPKHFDAWKQAEKNLKARDDEWTKIREIGEDDWLKYYNKETKKNNPLLGYDQAVEEASENLIRRGDDISNAKYDRTVGLTDRNYDHTRLDPNYDVKLNKYQQGTLAEQLERQKKRLNIQDVDLKNKVPNNLRELAEYKFNQNPSVRTAKKNLVELINERERNRFKFYNEPEKYRQIETDAINKLIKQQLSHLDRLRVPRDSYIPKMQEYVESIKLLQKNYKDSSPLMKLAKGKESSKYLDEIDEMLPKEVSPVLKMKLQLLSDRLKQGEDVNKLLDEVTHKFVGHMDDVKPQKTSDAIFDDVRKSFPQASKVEEEIPAFDKALNEDIDIPKSGMSEEELQRTLDEFLGVNPQDRIDEEAKAIKAIGDRIAKGKQPLEEVKSKKNPLLKLYDEATKDFKAMVTVNKPGWHGANYLQNKILNAQDIGIDALKNRGKARGIFKGKEGYITNSKTGEMIPYAKLKSILEDEGVLDSNTLHDITNNGGNNPLSKLFNDVIRPSGKHSIGSGFGLLQKNPDESLSKIQNVISHLEKGDDVYDAIDKAQKTLFDYDDLSKFEKDVMKRAIPFYAYMRKNTQNQLGYMLDDQRSYNKMANALRSIESGVDKKRQIEDDEQAYLGDRVQIPGMSVEQKGKRYDYMLDPKLPLISPSTFPEGILDDMGGSFNPLIQPLIDIAKNQDFFGNQIDDKGKYYKEEVTDSFTPPLMKLMQKIDKYKEKDKEFKINPQILNYLLGISGNYY